MFHVTQRCMWIKKLNVNLHNLLFSTLWAKDICSICNKAFANQGAFTYSTEEAIVVPVSIVKGDKSCSTDT